jgi:hypothetical protein
VIVASADPIFLHMLDIYLGLASFAYFVGVIRVEKHPLKDGQFLLGSRQV